MDKTTNTEPLIILSPDEINKLGCGAHLITFKKSLQIFMTTNNSKITAVEQNEPMTSGQIVTPNTEAPTDLNDAYANQQNIIRKGKEINEILKGSLQDKQEKTYHSLSKMSLKINKQSVKTKKLVQKLTDKYCPLAKEIAKTPKAQAHITRESQTTSQSRFKHASHQTTKNTISHTISKNPQPERDNHTNSDELPLPHIRPATQRSHMISSTSTTTPVPQPNQITGYNKHTNLSQNNTPIDSNTTTAKIVRKHE